MEGKSRLSAEKESRQGQPLESDEQRPASPAHGDEEKQRDAPAHSVHEASNDLLPSAPSPAVGDNALAPQPAVAAVATPTAPNGGIRAWLQVLGSFCLYFNTWGNEAYANSMLHPFYQRCLAPGSIADQLNQESSPAMAHSKPSTRTKPSGTTVPSRSPSSALSRPS